jgi:hypothetical protein
VGPVVPVESEPGPVGPVVPVESEPGPVGPVTQIKKGETVGPQKQLSGIFYFVRKTKY